MAKDEAVLDYIEGRLSRLDVLVRGAKNVVVPVNKIITVEWRLFQDYLELRTRLDAEAKAVREVPLGEAIGALEKVKATAEEMKAILGKTIGEIAQLKKWEKRQQLYATLIRIILRDVEGRKKIAVLDSNHKLVKDAHSELVACEADIAKFFRDIRVLRREVYVELHSFLEVHLAELDRILKARKIDEVRSALKVLMGTGLLNQFEKCENICVAEERDIKERLYDFDSHLQILKKLLAGTRRELAKAA